MAPQGKFSESTPIWTVPTLAGALLGALAAVVVALSWAVPVLNTVISGMLTGAMLLIAIVDARLFKIPDILSLPAIPIGLLAAGALVDPNATTFVPAENILGMLAGGLGLYLFGAAYKAVRGREGIGLGDVKLLAVAGAWNGLSRLPSVLLLACLAALSYALVRRLALVDRGALDPTFRLPLGAFLAPSVAFFYLVDTIQASLTP